MKDRSNPSGFEGASRELPMGPLQRAGEVGMSRTPSSASPPNPVPPRNAADLLADVYPGVVERGPAVQGKLPLKKA